MYKPVTKDEIDIPYCLSRYRQRMEDKENTIRRFIALAKKKSLEVEPKEQSTEGLCGFLYRIFSRKKT